VERGREQEIILARNGKPVARIVPIVQPDRRIGIAEGEFGNLDEEWFKHWQSLDKDIQDILDARWERFERHSLELEQKYGGKKKKKSA
jgi:hypothetical protein